MGLLLIHALTGGRWGEAIRPQLVAGMITLPLLLPALIPLLFVLPALYPWARPDAAAHLDNRFYLNLPFFVGRGIVYLIVWFGLGGLILRALRQATCPIAALARIAPAGLILLAITVTYRRDRRDHVARSAFRLQRLRPDRDRRDGAVGAVGVRVRRRCSDRRRTKARCASLGKLLLGLLVLWAYLDFMQVLIVWQSDLPREAPWYVARSTGGWGIVAAVVAACHFVLPFFAAAVAAAATLARAASRCVAALLIAERGRPRLVAGGAGVRARLRSGRCSGDAWPARHRRGAGAAGAAAAGDAGSGAAPCLTKVLAAGATRAERCRQRASSGPACRWCSARCLLWRCWSCGCSRVPIDRPDHAPAAAALSRSPACSRTRARTWRKFYAEEMQRLNGTGWIDKAHGDRAHPDRRCDAQGGAGGHSGLADAAGEAAMRLLLLHPAAARSCRGCASAAPPPDFSGFAYQQKPGSQLPLQRRFRDETGRSVRLSELLGGKPLILALGLFPLPQSVRHRARRSVRRARARPA